jgi:hypothetical protein
MPTTIIKNKLALPGSKQGAVYCTKMRESNPYYGFYMAKLLEPYIDGIDMNHHTRWSTLRRDKNNDNEERIRRFGRTAAIPMLPRFDWIARDGELQLMEFAFLCYLM